MGDALLRQLGFGAEVDARNAGLCPRCKRDTGHAVFLDHASERESKITGFCQPCQDVVFAEDEED